jgi:flagellar hook-length control protein FliK
MHVNIPVAGTTDPAIAGLVLAAQLAGDNVDALPVQQPMSGTLGNSSATSAQLLGSDSSQALDMPRALNIAAAEAPSSATASQSSLQSQMPPLLLVAGADPFAARQTDRSAPMQATAPAPARQSLAEALGQRLHVYIDRGTGNAVIRLDPPMKGSIEITIRQDQSGVQIHLRASDGEVARQLQNIGDALRQDLIQRQHGEVSVQVSDGSRDGQGRQRQRQENPEQGAPGRAFESEDTRERTAFALAQPGRDSA